MFGPLGITKANASREEFDGNNWVYFFEKYVSDRKVLLALVQDCCPTQLTDAQNQRSSAVIQTLLTHGIDKSMISSVNKLIETRVLTLELPAFYDEDNAPYPYCVTRYGLILRDSDDPVEELASLLIRKIGKQNLTPELRDYSGEFRSQVLQYCLRTNPEKVLELLGKVDLREIATGMGFVRLDDAKDRRELCFLVLLGLGFFIPLDPIGIKTFQDRLAKLRDELQSSEDENERAGLMSQVYVVVERILKDLCFFYSSAIWGDDLGLDYDDDDIVVQSLAKVLKRRLGFTRPIERLGFGDFVELIRRLSAFTDSNTKNRTRMMKMFERKRVLPLDQMNVLDEVSKFRARFAHAGESLSKAASIQLLDRIVGFVRTIVESEIYPRTIRINYEVTDEYGKSYAEAIDEGGNKWTIYYSDFYVEPEKHHYLMYTKTKEIALKPILIRRFWN